MRSVIEKCIAGHQEAIELVKSSLLADIAAAASLCAVALQKGNKLLICGNGGSAADSQHLAAEFVGRFQLERKGLPAIALTTDTSILTAVGNDYGFEQIFARQVDALGCAGDVLLALSTSGNSKNVLQAIQAASALEIKVIGFTGGDGGKIKPLCDVCLNVGVPVTARVQEAHILMGHILCELLDDLNYDA